MNSQKNTKVKICGIRTPDAMTAALEAGVDFVGLVFHPASPRYVEIEVAAYLANYVPGSVMVVGLFSNASDETIRQTVENARIDMLQLHGDETPEECARLLKLFGRPIMKALSANQIGDADAYADTCAWLVIDAPAPLGATYEGGHGQSFDWSVLKDFAPAKPWMLAGGLTPENVGSAIQIARPFAVDVSSGVEVAKGIKDPAKIRAFIKAAKGL